MENVTKAIVSHFANNPIVEYQNIVREGEVLDITGDTKKSSKLLKWYPKTVFKEGIKRIIN